MFNLILLWWKLEELEVGRIKSVLGNNSISIHIGVRVDLISFELCSEVGRLQNFRTKGNVANNWRRWSDVGMVKEYNCVHTRVTNCEYHSRK